MDKLNVAYYLPEQLVSRIDERSYLRSSNRSRQVADDLNRFYDMLESGLQSALNVLSNDEIRVVIEAIRSKPLPVSAKHALIGTVRDLSIVAKIESLDDIACLALWDWARTNTRG